MGITNTKTLPPELMMLEMLSGPGAIEAQEARGQRELVNSTQLPVKGSADPAWAKVGVQFGEPDQGDPLFVPATLPVGWKTKATDHSMWSSLVDDKGRTRASIFYKAAFYDRDAFMRLECRFGIRRVYENTSALQHEVIDGQVRVFVTAEVPNPKPGDWEAREAVEKSQRDECVAWLAARYANWEDPSAHWD